MILPDHWAFFLTYLLSRFVVELVEFEIFSAADKELLVGREGSGVHDGWDGDLLYLLVTRK